MKEILNFIRNLSVSWKFIIIYLAVLFIPVIFSGIYLYVKTMDSTTAQAELVMEQNLLQTRSSILQKVKVIENTLQIITSDNNVQAVIDYEYTIETNRLEDYQFTIAPYVENILRQNSAINAIRIYSPNFIITEMIDSYYSIRKMKVPDWYNEMSAKKPSHVGWSSTHDAMIHALKPNQINLEQVFSYSGEIYSINSRNSTNLLEIEVKESALLDMLRDPVINTWGKVFVVNDEGMIVSNNIPELFKKNVSESGFTGYIKESKLNQVEMVNGIQSIAIAIPVKEIKCSIVGIFPVDNFNTEVKGSIINIMVVLMILATILGVITYVITNVLLRRVKRLVKAMKQVKEGNLDVSVPVKSMDEFGELGSSFNHMIGRIHDLVETVYKIQIMEREAELKALEAQINPHFLYNTLATISWVARKANSIEIVKISNALAKFYRLVLNRGNTLIHVKDELEMVTAYLHIQKIRFEDAFDVVYEIDESVYQLKVLKHILQPIVENALNHGIEPKRGHGTIIIKVWQTEDSLFFQVIDDGVGMNTTELSEVLSSKIERSTGSGYAVKNIMERLKAYYGEAHSFDIFSRPGIGTVITIIANKIRD